MTALPIILGAKQYKEYLVLQTGPTNQINNDKLIETLRKMQACSWSHRPV
jgi:hypothetical protein